MRHGMNYLSASGKTQPRKVAMNIPSPKGIEGTWRGHGEFQRGAWGYSGNEQSGWGLRGFPVVAALRSFRSRPGPMLISRHQSPSRASSTGILTRQPFRGTENHSYIETPQSPRKRYYIILYYIILHHIILYVSYAILYYDIIYYSMTQHNNIARSASRGHCPSQQKGGRSGNGPFGNAEWMPRPALAKNAIGEERCW